VRSDAWLSCLVLVAAGACSSAPTQNAAPSPTPPFVVVPRHLELAESLLAEVSPADTNYQHKPVVVAWAGDAGHARAECRADCSGFVDAVLRRAYAISEKNREAPLGAKKRPLARTFHDAIADGRGFERVALADARPGDVLAIGFPAGAEDTGHVMFLASAPRPRDATAPLVDGTTQWDIDVLDSTGSPHGPTDTRFVRGGKARSGVGRGTIRVYANADGSLAGYAWSVSPASAFRAQDQRDAAIGRFVPPKKKT